MKNTILTDKQKRALEESLKNDGMEDVAKNLVELLLVLEDIEVIPERLEKNAWQFTDRDGKIVKY